MPRKSIISLLLITSACVASPDKVVDSNDTHLIQELTIAPEGFPEIPFPENNRFTAERWKLGKRLFYDPALSKDYSLSCASCHKLDLGLADSVAVSAGVNARLGNRNAPSLANVAYQKHFMREGAVPTLERQVLVPIQDHNELDMDILEITNRLSQDTQYIRMSQEAYGRSLDPYVITRSIATFERTFISGRSRYDQYLKGEMSLTEDELAGRELFFSERTSCSSCHSGFNFTNDAIENTGWYTIYEDPGKFRLTIDSADIGKFKVPSLRNVAITAPYLHNGSVASLDSIVAHYNRGANIHPNQNVLIRPLELSDDETAQLVAFLGALTDSTFITNELLIP